MGSTDSVAYGARRHVWPLTALAVTTLIGLAAVSGPEAAAQFASALAGVCLMVASGLFYLGWRLSPVASTGWLVVSAVLLSSQLLFLPMMSLTASQDTVDPSSLLVHSVATILAVAFVVVGVRPDAPRCPDPVALGLGTGAVFVAARLLLSTTELHATAALPGAAVVILFGHLVLAVVSVRSARLPAWVADRLAVTIVLLGVTEIVLATSFGGPVLDAVVSTMCATASISWAAATYVVVTDKLENRQRRTAALEATVMSSEDSQRATREQVHELRSTVAGLASAARLANDPRIDDAAVSRLHRSIQSELERMERLLTPAAPATNDHSDSDNSAPDNSAPVDLDESLDSVLALHRARGRQIQWTPTGARFVGRQDALKEAVNILLDNAAVHGGADGTRVDVRDAGDMVQIAVTDDGPGVPQSLRDQIFDWGKSRPGSPGQGIGLNVARRLVAEQGGSLSLSSPREGGSSFVINLPRVRQSQENSSVPTEHKPG